MNDASRRLLELRDEVGGQWKPLLTKAAQLMATVEGEATHDRCRRCFGPVTQPRTGRRRKYCTTCSPRKTRENAKVRP